MGQVTIYLDDETEHKMNEAANLRRMSKSRWVADVIREKLVDQWPDSVRELAGSWQDFPSLEDIRNGTAPETPRESL